MTAELIDILKPVLWIGAVFITFVFVSATALVIIVFHKILSELKYDEEEKKWKNKRKE